MGEIPRSVKRIDEPSVIVASFDLLAFLRANTVLRKFILDDCRNSVVRFITGLGDDVGLVDFILDGFGLFVEFPQRLPPVSGIGSRPVSGVPVSIS